MRVRLRVTDHVQRVECCALVEQLEGLVRVRLRLRLRVGLRLRVRVSAPRHRQIGARRATGP